MEIHLVTARVQMVTRKQPATIIQPQPPSGGDAEPALVIFVMVSILVFFSFQVTEAISYDLECLLPSNFLLILKGGTGCYLAQGLLPISRGQLQCWRRRAHMPPARRPLPTAPGVLFRPRGGERTGRRLRRGRGRRQRPPDTVTGEIPPPRPGEAKLSVTPAPRVALPCWPTGRVPGSALRWGFGHG